MKYLKLFEEIFIKVGNIYKQRHSVDGEYRISISKLVKLHDDKFEKNDRKFGEFHGIYIKPDHCKGEKVEYIGMIENLDEWSIPSKEEIKEYKLLKNMNKYNL